VAERLNVLHDVFLFFNEQTNLTTLLDLTQANGQRGLCKYHQFSIVFAFSPMKVWWWQLQLLVCAVSHAMLKKIIYRRVNAYKNSG
jgi:hypothetical protein